jgi:hypothetical protein
MNSIRTVVLSAYKILATEMIWTGTVKELARKVWPGQRQHDEMFNVNADGSGVYKGTKTPLRKIPMNHEVSVDNNGRVHDNDGGWIADRIGALGARQRAKLLMA